MGHEFREGAGVGVANVCAEGRETLGTAPIAELNAREAVEIGFHPGRRVAREGVFPRAEPEHHDLEVVLSRAFKQAIDVAEIELSLARLNCPPRRPIVSHATGSKTVLRCIAAR